MIKVEDLQKTFGNNEVLKGINFSVQEGEILAIIGPSGSGKSTLLRCLNFLEKPNDGFLSIDNRKVSLNNIKNKDVLEIRRKMTMVFQHYNLFKNKKALDNVIEALLVVKRMQKNDAIKIGKELLEKVGLEKQIHQYPVTLSGGQQQRVGIARALATDPKVLLFDEPTSALDPEWVEEVLKVIKDITHLNKTMILVTHEMQFAEEVADRIIFMADGHIIEEGTPNEVFHDTKHPKTKKFIKSIHKSS